MSIYKRGGIYWFEFIYNSRRVRRSTKTGNRKAARDIESAYRTKLAKGDVGIESPKKIPTFATAMKAFLDWSKQEHAAHPNTHKRYQTSAKALNRFFRDVPINQISAATVETFKTWRSRQKGFRTQRPLRPATINRELACLKILFNRFIKEEVIDRNPVSSVKLLHEDNEQTRVLNADEEKIYLLAASQPLEDIATLMLQTGMRPEEVCRLQRNDINLDRGYLAIPYGKTRSARRKIPLSGVACSVLTKRLKVVNGSFLFPGRVADKPIVKVNAAHKAAIKRSGVKPFRLYDLRHTWASRAAMAGVDLVTLAAMLGHSRIQMVLRYAHPTEEHQFQAMRKLEVFTARR